MTFLRRGMRCFVSTAECLGLMVFRAIFLLQTVKHLHRLDLNSGVDRYKYTN